MLGYIAGDSEGDSYTNIVGNAFISGPSTQVHPFTRGNSYFHTFVQNNYYDPDQVGVAIEFVLLQAVLTLCIGRYSQWLDPDPNHRQLLWSRLPVRALPIPNRRDHAQPDRRGCLRGHACRRVQEP
jgi:hypothetical protein